NDSNKVWLHPLCYFKNLKAEYINPIYAFYNAEKQELTMPLGQVLFKRSGFNIVNIVSYDGKNITNTGDVVLHVSINNNKKEISIDPSYTFGVGDANKNYEWQESFKGFCLTQENTAQHDIELSTTEFYFDTEVGTPLADVITINPQPDAVISYEVFGPKDKNFDYTTSPYQIVDGKLIATEPITATDKFKYILIRATDTHTGEWIDKDFYINIISLHPNLLAGQYYAYAKSSFRDFPDEEWQVSITVDENDNNKLWIQPVCMIHNFTAENILPVYATFDAKNSTISMPLGQTLYEDDGEYKLITASSTSASNINTTGVAIMRVHQNEDIIEITFDYNHTFGVGNAIDDSWWYQALHDIVYSNREIIAINDIYYNIIDTTLKSVEVTYRGVDFNDYADEYYDEIEIPATILHKDETYTVTGIRAQTFYNCGTLYTIALPNTITEIGDEAFALCNNLYQIDILATTPPVIYANTFDGVDRSIPVNVPNGCGEAYRNAPYWCEFTNINEDSSVEETLSNTKVKVGTTNGHVTITGAKDDAVVNIYSLCGMLLHHTTVAKANMIELAQGIYLVQIDGTTYKVVI
ncbi:MAG: leucine-rich repeat protein, partial [Bacteroidales bacterium]|nr:leucine-rich repeat protein [Bacteroidales bacterium]